MRHDTDTFEYSRNGVEKPKPYLNNILTYRNLRQALT